MLKKLNRRSFFKKSFFASAGAVIGCSYEEKSLLKKKTEGKAAPVLKSSTSDMPRGKIGNIEMSRLTIGSNLFGGGAHARDLMYVSPLLKHYFTEEKILDTLQLCEENGIDMNIDVKGEYANKYNKERGGKMRWIAEVPPKGWSPDQNPTHNNVTSAAQIAIDNGAVGAFIWGAQADRWVQLNRLDLIDEFVSFVKKNGLVAGVGGHSKNVPMACEKAGLDIDFYFKTLHSGNYWSATPIKERFEYKVDSHVWGGNDDFDNIWSLYPEKTTQVMKDIKKSWMAYKVLAAGGIHPRDGFKYAFENGADIICVGMLDYQITEDATIAKEILAELEKTGRDRPWRA